MTADATRAPTGLRRPPVAARAGLLRIGLRARPTRSVVSSSAGKLSAPVQDAAAAIDPTGRVLLLGGLTAADTSTDAVVAVAHSSSRLIGRLPIALHDAGGARIGSRRSGLGGGGGL